MRILQTQWNQGVARFAQQLGQRAERPGNTASSLGFKALFHSFFRTLCGRLHGSLRPMARERILLIEDEPDIAEVLQYNLEKEGFAVEVARRGDSGLEALRREPADLLVLDLMLPGIDGLELTRLLKRDATTSRLPIVMLTARGEEVDRIVGLELGADDYISKPFSPREVVLRGKAVLRRLQPEDAARDLRAAGAIEL